MKARIVCGISILFWAAGLSGKVGCMDNSWHLQKPFDNKSYHDVACNCPCDEWKAKGLYAKNTHRCLQCRHAHMAHPVLILSHIPTRKEPPPTYPASLQAIAQHFKLLVRQIREKRQSLFDNKKRRD